MKVLVALSTILVLGSAQLSPEPEGIKDVGMCIYGVAMDAVDEIKRKAGDAFQELQNVKGEIKSLNSLKEFKEHVSVSREDIMTALSEGRYTDAIETCKVSARNFIRLLNTCITEVSEKALPKTVKIITDIRSKVTTLPVTAGIKAAMCISKIN